MSRLSLPSGNIGLRINVQSLLHVGLTKKRTYACPPEIPRKIVVHYFQTIALTKTATDAFRVSSCRTPHPCAREEEDPGLDSGPKHYARLAAPVTCQGGTHMNLGERNLRL
jgi:hypothetical protein